MPVPSCCVALGKKLNFSRPLFPSLGRNPAFATHSPSVSSSVLGLPCPWGLSPGYQAGEGVLLGALIPAMPVEPRLPPPPPNPAQPHPCLSEAAVREAGTHPFWA